MTAKKLGARVRIKGKFHEEANKLFIENEVIPMKCVHRKDGDVTFEIEELNPQRLQLLLDRIPKEFFALKALVK